MKFIVQNDWFNPSDSFIRITGQVLFSQQYETNPYFMCFISTLLGTRTLCQDKCFVSTLLDERGNSYFKSGFGFCGFGVLSR